MGSCVSKNAIVPVDEEKLLASASAEQHGDAARSSQQQRAGATSHGDALLRRVQDGCSAPLPELAASGRAEALQKDAAALLKPGNVAPATAARVLRLLLDYVDAAMGPAVAALEARLSRRQPDAALSSGVASWETATADDVAAILRGAFEAHHGLPLAKGGAALSCLLQLGRRLCDYCSAHDAPLPPAQLECAALGSVLAALSACLFKKVALETAESLSDKFGGWMALRGALGLSDLDVQLVARPEHKALLLHLSQGVQLGGERKASFRIRRSAALFDAKAQAAALGLLDLTPPPAGGAAGGGSKKQAATGASASLAPKAQWFKAFPQFVEDIASESRPACDAEQADAAGGSGGGMYVDAGEGHGPRKEFFALCGANLVGKRWDSAAQALVDASPPPPPPFDLPPLFAYERTAGCYWPNRSIQRSPESEALFVFAGWLFGQSVANRAALGIRLPAPLFQLLLDGPAAYKPTLSTLEAFDPTLASNLRAVLRMPKQELRSFLELEGEPADTPAERYVSRQVQELLAGSISWQAAAMRYGLLQAADAKLMASWGIGGGDLAQVVSGTDSAATAAAAGCDVRRLFRIAVDTELSGPSAPLAEALWEVLDGWTADQRRAFLKFVTGTEQPPAPGTEVLKVESPSVALGEDEHAETLLRLPTSHTCDNLLELPNYWVSLLFQAGYRKAAERGAVPADKAAALRAKCAALLGEKLLTAVTGYGGYGLDELAGSLPLGGGGGGGGGGGQQLSEHDSNTDSARPSGTSGIELLGRYDDIVCAAGRGGRRAARYAAAAADASSSSFSCAAAAGAANTKPPPAGGGGDTGLDAVSCSLPSSSSSSQKKGKPSDAWEEELMLTAADRGTPSSHTSTSRAHQLLKAGAAPAPGNAKRRAAYVAQPLRQQLPLCSEWPLSGSPDDGSSIGAQTSGHCIQPTPSMAWGIMRRPAASASYLDDDGVTAASSSAATGAAGSHATPDHHPAAAPHPARTAAVAETVSAGAVSGSPLLPAKRPHSRVHAWLDQVEAGDRVQLGASLAAE